MLSLNTLKNSLQKHWLQGFLASRKLFPAQCLLCLEGITNKNYLCSVCFNSLIKNTFACSSCAEPMPALSFRTEKLLCSRCAKKLPAFNQVLAPWLYANPYKQLITEFKYQQNLAAGYLIVQMLASYLNSLSATDNNPAGSLPYQLLLVMPGQKHRTRQRGIHAPTWLAQRLSLLTDIKFEPKALKLKKNISSQQTLSQRERWFNPAGAFIADAQQVENKHILLLDDVLTTGASCHWAADELLNQGAKQVDVIIAARTAKVDD